MNIFKKINKNLYLFIFLLFILLVVFINIYNIKENYENYDSYNGDESECKYINSHGIVKAFKDNKISNIYYIKTNELNSFNIPNDNFILVTNNDDSTIPDDFREKSNEILNSPNLIHWYSQNLNDLTNKKLTSIPIGLDYHTIGNGKQGYEWGGKQETPVKQEELIFKLNLISKPFYKREIKLYINFINTINRNPNRYGKKDRQDAIDQIPKDLQVIEENNVPRKESWEHMIQYVFVVSPLGNGLDCHRTWEALVLGCIPIVKTSSLDILYKDLPVLIVKNWYDINEELLKNTIGEFKNKTFNYDKLTLEYWKNIILNN